MGKTRELHRTHSPLGIAGPSSFPLTIDWLKHNTPPSAVVGATLQMAPHVRLEARQAPRASTSTSTGTGTGTGTS